MNGLELLAHMRKHRPQVPCVAMTDPKTPDVENKAFRDSVFRSIAKPFSADELFTLIMEGLERLDEGLFWREQRSK